MTQAHLNKIQSPSKKILGYLTLLFMFIFNSLIHATTDPCSGPSALLNVVDRPTAADSACVISTKKAVLELGYQYQQLAQSSTNAQNYPEAELRLGLQGHSEFVVLLPNYTHQSISPRAGFSAISLGLKHEIGYTEHWLAAIESLITTPNGSDAFGSQDLGIALSGILTYTFNPSWNVSFMLGESSETLSRFSGGQRFNSLNPDLVLTYSATPTLNIYGEVYGQSHTGPGEGSGFNLDGGLLYLVASNITVDIELGQRISGNLGGFNRYIGSGIAIMF